MRLHPLPYGDRAWLIECESDPVAAAEWLTGLPWPSQTETIVGASTCLIKFAGRAPSRAAMEAALANAPTRTVAGNEQPQTIVIEVRYDGADLASVAELVDLTPREVVDLHTAATYRVAFLGFAPGFGYLTGLPARLQLPRRAAPRIRVPAGSVAIADRYSAVYPRPSPGGWHLLGTSNQWLFDPDRPTPSLLRPGMQVRFQESR